MDPADLDAFRPRFNIAPTQAITCVLPTEDTGGRQLAQLRWGLVPAWAKDLAIGNRMINARSETVDSKPSFRSAFKSRRCLIPADGYFEWKKVSDGKQPYLIERAGGGVFAMAGLWEKNCKASPDGTTIRSCTVITTAANQATSAVHDRMPVMIAAADYGTWLGPDTDSDILKSLLHPAPEDLLCLTPVSRRVNSPRNDDADCVLPLAE